MPKNDKIAILDDEERPDEAVYIKQHDRSHAFRLAIISLILFISAMSFLCLFLITPIIYSLNHPVTHEDGNHSMSNGMVMASASSPPSHMSMSDDADGSMEHHHKRRDVLEDEEPNYGSVNHLKDLLQEYIQNVCPCVKSLDSTEIKAEQFEECLRECKQQLVGYKH